MKEEIGNGDHHHEDFLLNAIRMKIYPTFDYYILCFIYDVDLILAYVKLFLMEKQQKIRVSMALSASKHMVWMN